MGIDSVYVESVKTVVEATLSDHKPKRMRINLKERQWRRGFAGKRVPRLRWEVLEENEEKRQEYKMKMEQKMQGLEEGS